MLYYHCGICGGDLPCHKHTIPARGRHQLEIYTNEILPILRGSTPEVWPEFFTEEDPQPAEAT